MGAGFLLLILIACIEVTVSSSSSSSRSSSNSSSSNRGFNSRDFQNLRDFKGGRTRTEIPWRHFQNSIDDVFWGPWLQIGSFCLVTFKKP